MLTNIQITTLESIAEMFGGITDLEMACRQYRRELGELNPWKINLANLERLNGQAFAKVLQTIPPQRRGEVASFIQKNKGKPLPNLPRYDTLSAAKAANP